MENYTQKITPRRFVYHMTSRFNRSLILKKGLLASSSEGIGYKNAVFAHNTKMLSDLWYPYVMDHWAWFGDNTRIIHSEDPLLDQFLHFHCYDIWRIDTRKFKRDWFIDNVAGDDFLRNPKSSYYIVTFGNITVDEIKLVNLEKPVNIHYTQNGVAHVTSQFR